MSKRKREEDEIPEPDFDDEALDLDLDDLDELDDAELNDETLAKIRKLVDAADVCKLLFCVKLPRLKDLMLFL